jgi:ribosomal protein L7Ae-like RNA K-turn-binding protein
LSKAQRALSKSLKTRITTTAEELVQMVRAQADRRFAALLNSAARQRALAVGKTRVEKLLAEEKVALVIATRDARAALDSASIQRSIQSGLAVAWGDKARLGELVGREEAAVVAVLDDGLAKALKTTIAMAHLGHQGPFRTGRDKRVNSAEVG